MEIVFLRLDGRFERGLSNGNPLYEDAKNFINQRVDPDNWRVIRQIDFIGEWECIDQQIVVKQSTY